MTSHFSTLLFYYQYAIQTKYTYKILKKDEAMEPKYANKVRTTFNRPRALRGHVTNASFKQ